MRLLWTLKVSTLNCTAQFSVYFFYLFKFFYVSWDVDAGLFGSAESNEEKTLEFSEDEEALVIRMYNLVGKRYVLKRLFLSVSLVSRFIIVFISSFWCNN